MGRVNSMNNNAPNQIFKHFSHPHELELVILRNPNPIPSICSVCKLEESGQMYICRPCNFSLHLSCTQFPELIVHPCHPDHPLTLLPSSSYPGGVFNCDACNRRGDGFNYHCALCEFDLHVLCASKPLKIMHQMHKCPLELAFKNPYDDVKGFSCDVCGRIGIKQWLYRCSSCEFDVHLDCSTASAPKPPVQPLVQPLVQSPTRHQHSFPGSASQKQILHTFPGSASETQIHNSFLGSTSHAQFQDAPLAVGPLIRPNQLQQSGSTGAIPYNQFVQTHVTAGPAGGYARPNQYMQQPAITNTTATGNGLLNAAIPSNFRDSLNKKS